jgi:hypothetical protein
MITLTREEAQQVLDALDSKYIVNCGAWRVQRDAAIETLRARLAQPEPEPVAWIKKDRSSIEVSIMSAEYMRNEGFEPLYTAPPQREWQGLTDDEMNEAMDYWSDPVRSAYGGAHSADGEYVGMIDTWRYIEAKLKEKNGG